MDLDIPEGDPDQALVLVEPLCECSLSSCLDSGTEDSNIKDRASHRQFSRLLREIISRRNVVGVGAEALATNCGQHFGRE